MSAGERKPPTLYLKPGEIHFAETGVLVSTILGSCLAVTLWNRRVGISAICHGVLPKCKIQGSCHGQCIEKFKYVDCSLKWMIERFVTRGVDSQEIEVKLFGGSDMFPSEEAGGSRMSVGRQNTGVARKILDREGLHIVSYDVGGSRGRKIIFDTGTGEVLLKYLRKSNLPEGEDIFEARPKEIESVLKGDLS
jgi:chemotaxis protein CheD